MFYEAMLTSGVGSKLAHLMYLAVYYGGPRWDELTIRNSRLMHPDTHLTASVSQALTSLRGALAAGNLSAANFALANAQNDMKTNGDQYVVADATRAISIAVNDKSTQGAALEAMISSGIPDASSLAVLYSQRATIAYESGDKAVAAKNARAALDFGVNPDAVDLIAALKREGIPAVESSTSAFEPNVLEFKRLANIVDERDLTLDQIEKLVNEVRAK